MFVVSFLFYSALLFITLICCLTDSSCTACITVSMKSPLMPSSSAWLWR